MKLRFNRTPKTKTKDWSFNKNRKHLSLLWRNHKESTLETGFKIAKLETIWKSGKITLRRKPTQYISIQNKKNKSNQKIIIYSLLGAIHSPESSIAPIWHS